MVGVYFSGTGNLRYVIEVFLRSFEAKAFSIENDNVIEEIKKHEHIVFSYPVQYSTVPKILRDFIIENKSLWSNKKVFIIATMGLFSGDGAGSLWRLLKKYGAEIIGGLHVKMPDSIADEKALKRSKEKNGLLVRSAKKKIEKAAMDMKAGNPPKEGIGLFYQMAGLFGQRLYFGHNTKQYRKQIKIDTQKCIGCRKCEKLCPMHNLELIDGKVKQKGKCTMCYRCVNYCPQEAITILGKEVVEQSVIEKYL
ncbi:MAG: EFR1 family ferrodoxin [Lachnospiraceae bacterium]|nr:EFR1 family ferrodoxin [Lachnospiraceae bacterium]